MEENTRDLVVYVLLRTDLPSMNPGKAAAQVHHAGVQMMARHSRSQLVQDYVTDGLAQGAVSFNTTLVLGATMQDITDRRLAAEAVGDDSIVFNTITDPSYPFLVENMEIAALIPQDASTKIIRVLDNGKVLMVRPEVTCAWFCGDRNNSQFCSLFDGFNLHP